LRRLLLLLLFCCGWGPSGPAAAQTPAPGAWPAGESGPVVAIGGALSADNTEVWQRLVQLAGGPGACYAVLTTAAADPDASAAAAQANLQRHGASTVHLRIGPRIAGQDTAAAVRDAGWIAKLLSCRGVYMTGGAQARLLDVLMPQGRASPLLDAMAQLWRAGGVVAGSSAGTAVLSQRVFRSAPDPLAVMKGRLREGQEWSQGFGFVASGVIVDQHAVRRGRAGRLLPLMLLTGAPLGLGIEEDSAAIFHGQTVEVIGARGVLVADLSQASTDPQLGAFNLRGGTLHWLESGDRFDLQTRQVLASASKRSGRWLQPLSAGHKGYFHGKLAFNDILGDSMLIKAMSRLVDSDQKELRGLAFAARPEADDSAPTLAFEWRLWVDGETQAWLKLNPEAYTVIGVKLDIVPQRLQQPLLSPWAHPAPPASRVTPSP